MNKIQKRILFAGLITVGASIIVWISYGGEIFTKTQILIERRDELFPDIVQREWVDKFIWGLDLTATISGIIVVICSILIFLFRTRKKNTELS